VLLQSGRGWRLAVDPSRQPFVVLIGGGDWAAELSPAEGAALLRGVATLVRQHDAISCELMAEEAICLELAMDLDPGELWLELEGNKEQWQLRFVLTPSPGQRGLEGSWSVGASAAIAAAMAGAVVPTQEPPQGFQSPDETEATNLH
jgi:hypothetical protein